VLALRQKLLRMRNTAPEPAASSSPAKEAAVPATAPSSSSRQQSDMQKELGNQAMAEKQHVNAVMFYSNAIKLDDTNLAAFNNRALAHMKQSSFALAEADATVVVDGTAGASAAADAQDGSHTLRLKALCRRAQARRGLGDALVSAPAGTADAERKYREAVADLQELLKSDSSNKTALAELKQLKEALKRCEDARVSNVSAGSGLPSPPVARSKDTLAKASTAAAAVSPVQPPAAPRADMNRVSAMLSPGGASPSAFGDLGLVARSSKKLGSGAAAVSSPSPAKAPAAESAATPVTDKKATATASSPPPSVALTAAPSEPPKTVYE
jgi:tetratricopeptide (TPR) repeat protein